MRGIWRVLGLAGVVLGGSCSARNVTVDQAVAVYVPKACGDASHASVTYTGLGDFQPTSDPTEVVPLASVGFALTAPTDTREVVIGPLAVAGPWAGAAFVPAAGDVSLLALPLNQACQLSGSAELDGNAGATLGMLDGTHVLLVGGAIPPFEIDLGTGIVTQASTAPAPPRSYASVTALGSGALIAGGENPAGEVADTATVYLPATGGAATYSDAIVLPAGQREKHAAVTLPDGRVLLVGGAAQGGALVTDLEAVDPTTSTATRVGSLAVGRTSPTVLVLPNGQLFVGGGFSRAGAPVTTVEWFALPNLTRAGRVDLCSAGMLQGFAPTEAGAVLAVMGPAPASGTCSNVHLLRPPISNAAPVVESAPALTPPPASLRVFQGAEGSPLIVTESAALRWDPWAAAFVSLGQTALGLSLPTAASIATSPGLALWLGEDDHLWTLRFDTRGPYATDFAHPLYLDTDSLFTAPDRLAGGDLTFGPATGASLANGATVFLTDATYEAVTASVTVLRGRGVDVVLRDPLGNEVVCRATGVADGGTVTVARNGASVTWTSGSSPAACTGVVDAPARVAVGLRGPSETPSVVRALTVMR